MAKIALLIGVSEYESDLSSLPAAVKDAEAMREILLNPEIGGFTESNITLLKNPDSQMMSEAIEILFSGRKKDDLLLLFFSGHGIKDYDSNKLYFATKRTRKNEQGELIRSTAVAASFIQETMSLCPSRRQVLILDSCFSGAFAEGLSVKDDGRINIMEHLGGEGKAILTSSSATQYSFEYEGSELSLYTRFLIEGIRTGAADLDGDEIITIDELHEYACQKVKEIKPEIKPEIYAIKEGYKIRLAKVPPVDPKIKYSREVEKWVKESRRGELSLIGKRTLEFLSKKLGLESSEAKAIEDKILEPYRQEFREKLQQYEAVFTEILQQKEILSEWEREELNRFQQTLELRNEDTIPIEAKVTARFKTYQQHLKDYETALREALKQDYPLTVHQRNGLQTLQQALELSDQEIAPIEDKVTEEVQTYHRNLEQYNQLFVTATQQEYPLSEGKRNELKQQQVSLGLTDLDVSGIEAEITTKIESYQQKLQQYEQAFIKATEEKHYPSQATRKQLTQTWQTLELNEIDVQTIESRINLEIKAHQESLQRYEQQLMAATQQQYPLSEAQENELKHIQQGLKLSDQDIAPITDRVKTEMDEYLHKVQQYEEVLSEMIQYEDPLTETTREELKRFQHILELSDEDVMKIEEKVIAIKNGDTSQNAIASTLEQGNEIENKINEPSETVSDMGNDSQPNLTPPPVDPKYRTDKVNASSSQTTNSDSSQQTSPPPVDFKYRTDKFSPPSSPSKEPPPVDFKHRTDRFTPSNSSYTPQQDSDAYSPKETTPPPVDPNYRTDKVNSSTSQSTNSESQKEKTQPPSNNSNTSNEKQQLPNLLLSKWIAVYVFSGGFFGFLRYHTMPGVFNVLFLGLIYGFILGILQWLILHSLGKYMRLWILLTTLACSVGLGLSYVCFDNLYYSSVSRLIVDSLYGVTQGLIIGAAQWFVLKRVINKAYLWIITMIMARITGIVLVRVIFASFSGIIGGLITGLVIGVITGIVLKKLLKNRKDFS